jgi:hypothetical protein
MQTPDEHADDLESEVIDGSASETGIETDSFPAPEDLDQRDVTNPTGSVNEPPEPTDLRDEGADTL